LPKIDQYHKKSINLRIIYRCDKDFFLVKIFVLWWYHSELSVFIWFISCFSSVVWIYFLEFLEWYILHIYTRYYIWKKFIHFILFVLFLDLINWRAKKNYSNFTAAVRSCELYNFEIKKKSAFFQLKYKTRVNVLFNQFTLEETCFFFKFRCVSFFFAE
jgi:hypothetical protein